MVLHCAWRVVPLLAHLKYQTSFFFSKASPSPPYLILRILQVGNQRPFSGFSVGGAIAQILVSLPELPLVVFESWHFPASTFPVRGVAPCIVCHCFLCQGLCWLASAIAAVVIWIVGSSLVSGLLLRHRTCCGERWWRGCRWGSGLLRCWRDRVPGPAAAPACGRGCQERSGGHSCVHRLPCGSQVLCSCVFTTSPRGPGLPAWTLQFPRFSVHFSPSPFGCADVWNSAVPCCAGQKYVFWVVAVSLDIDWRSEAKVVFTTLPCFWSLKTVFFSFNMFMCRFILIYPTLWLIGIFICALLLFVKSV